MARAYARTGSNHITWNEMLHGKAAKAGIYKLTITTIHNGKRATTTLSVKLR